MAIKNLLGKRAEEDTTYEPKTEHPNFYHEFCSLKKNNKPYWFPDTPAGLGFYPREKGSVNGYSCLVLVGSGLILDLSLSVLLCPGFP